MGIPGERGQVGPRVSLTKLCFYDLLKIDYINEYFLICTFTKLCDNVLGIQRKTWSNGESRIFWTQRYEMN